MIIDACYILDELDLLEIRLNILDPHVDNFVIVESAETFSGVPKPLHFQANKERFAKWQDKIIYHVVDDYPLDTELYDLAYSSPCTGDKEDKWMEEFYQKESLHKALVGLNDDDLVFISDVDEIWNPAILDQLHGDSIFKPRQLPYIYYLNQRSDEDWNGWTGTVVTKYKNIKNACINHLRTDGMAEHVIIENGGWHFCTLGGREAKMKSWASPGYDTFSDEVAERREKNKRIETVDLPQFILDNREKYKHLWKK